MTREEKRKELLENLPQFIGSENWYRHNINRKFLYTDGVKFVADTAGAYWLVDDIAIVNLTVPKVRQESFQVWTLKVREDGESRNAALVCDDGNDKQIRSTRIEFTDFPLDEIKFYVVFDGLNHTMMLPSEY